MNIWETVKGYQVMESIAKSLQSIAQELKRINTDDNNEENTSE